MPRRERKEGAKGGKGLQEVIDTPERNGREGIKGKELRGDMRRDDMNRERCAGRD